VVQIYLQDMGKFLKNYIIG